MGNRLRGTDLSGECQKRRYIILATDYATKWVEARATRRNDANTSAAFIFSRIIMRFGAPLELVSDRGTHFLNEVITELTDQYLIKHRKTTPYNPKANGLTERANGIIGNILNKVVAAHKTDWDQKLISAVHAYNTTTKTTTGKSPFFLVYGQEALQQIEMEIETFRVMTTRNVERSDGLTERWGALDTLEEARGDALNRTKEVQSKRKEDFDRKIPANHGIAEGCLVLLYDNRHKEFPGKLHIRWLGPYHVVQVFSNGTLQLADLGGQLLETRVNGSRVKLYIPEATSGDSSEENTDETGNTDLNLSVHGDAHM